MVCGAVRCCGCFCFIYTFICWLFQCTDFWLVSFDSVLSRQLVNFFFVLLFYSFFCGFGARLTLKRRPGANWRELRKWGKKNEGNTRRMWSTFSCKRQYKRCTEKNIIILSFKNVSIQKTQFILSPSIAGFLQHSARLQPEPIGNFRQTFLRSFT